MTFIFYIIASVIVCIVLVSLMTYLEYKGMKAKLIETRESTSEADYDYDYEVDLKLRDLRRKYLKRGIFITLSILGGTIVPLILVVALFSLTIGACFGIFI